MRNGQRTSGDKTPVVLGAVLLLLLTGSVWTGVWLIMSVGTGVRLFGHGHNPLAGHGKPGTDPGKARDDIQNALEGAVGAITPQVAHSDGWYWVVRDELDGEPQQTSTVYRMWSLQARIDKSKYQLLADQLARYWEAHGYTVGEFRNFAGANTHTFLTDERQISATSPDGVLVTLEMDAPGVSLQASLNGVEYAGTDVYGKDPDGPGRQLDEHSHQLTVAAPTADDPYWSHR